MDPSREPDLQLGAGADTTGPNAAAFGLTPRRGIAPVWHTVVLMLAVLAVSLLGIHRHDGTHPVTIHRVRTYGATAILEVALVGWVAFGVKLHGIPLRALFGRASFSLRAIAMDLGVAILFWILSMMALASIAMMWISLESVITHKPIPVSTRSGGQRGLAGPEQDPAAKAVVQLAPSNGREIACWLLLCMLVGISEELVFRGYLQNQFTRWASGAPAAGVVFSALLFGAAHGYEGVRAMFLLSVFGAFFSLLALLRKNLRAGVFAHSWHDAVAGMTVAILHSHHLL